MDNIEKLDRYREKVVQPIILRQISKLTLENSVVSIRSDLALLRKKYQSLTSNTT